MLIFGLNHCILYLILIVFTGCSLNTPFIVDPKNEWLWNTIPSKGVIDAVAHIEMEIRPAPDILLSENDLLRWRKSLEELLQEDMRKSNLFKQIVSEKNESYDLLIKLSFYISRHSFMYEVKGLSPSNENILGSIDGSASWGQQDQFSSFLNQAMGKIRADMLKVYNARPASKSISMARNIVPSNKAEAPIAMNTNRRLAMPPAQLEKLAVWDMAPRNISPDYSQQLSEIMASEITKMNKYEVYSQENVRTLAGWEAQKMQLGCTDAKCLTVLGQMEVSKLISGTVGRIGSTYSISLSLFDTVNVKVINRISEECNSENELISLVRSSIRKLLRD